MRQLLMRPWARIGVGVAVILVVAVAVGAFYLFGGSGKSSAGDSASASTFAPSKDATILTIDPSSSQATFTIDEVLFGKPNTVVGKTNSLTGQIQVNLKDPSQSQVGQIRVDLSTLATDNDLRNRTLQSRILETAQQGNQYAVFVPKSLKGLPSTISLGQPVSFQITGDLTIHQVTRSVTFDAKVTLTSSTTLTGQAQTTVSYKDFNLAIPNVPSVTGVSDTVQLALTFTAKA
ncbi:MAG TPA: YceI family protein [Ktedonobacterales bacterium]